MQGTQPSSSDRWEPEEGKKDGEGNIRTSRAAGKTCVLVRQTWGAGVAVRNCLPQIDCGLVYRALSPPSLPCLCCHKTDEYWGQLSHVHSFRALSPAPAQQVGSIVLPRQGTRPGGSLAASLGSLPLHWCPRAQGAARACKVVMNGAILKRHLSPLPLTIQLLRHRGPTN